MSDTGGGGGFDDGGAASDSVTEASPGWLNRMGSSLVGVLIGLILVPATIALLAWNESRSVKEARSLSEAGHVVVEGNAAQPDPAQNGKLVHFAGPLTIAGALTDPDFPVRAPGAAVLRREVSTYGWTENRRTNSDHSTTYTYTKEWSRVVADSRRFHSPTGHENKPPHSSELHWVAQDAMIGVYRIPATLLETIEGVQERSLPPSSPAPGTVLEADGLYYGADPARPQVGDQRVTWYAKQPTDASVVAQQQGGAVAPYQARAGHDVYMISAGLQSAAAMIKVAEQDNVALTWVLRGLFALFMAVGFGLILGPLSTLFSFIPFVGDAVSAGVTIAAVAVTMIVAPVVVAFAWLTVRPLTGGAVLLVAVAGVILLVLRSRAHRARVAGSTKVGVAAATG